MNAEQRWNALKGIIETYILFGKIDRHCGNVVLFEMEEMAARCEG